MKKIIFILIIGFLVLPIYGQFRDTKWGMSKEEVRNIESLKIIHMGIGSILYKARILNLDSSLIYIFVDNRLVSSEYHITEEHANDNKYIYDWEKLRDALNEKYGIGEENIFWSDDLYINEKSEWGNALINGHVTFFAKWKTEDTKIILALYSENYEARLVIRLIIEYLSIEYENLEEEYRKKKEEGTL